MKKVSVFLDKLFVDHDNGPGHPESPHRILVIADSLRENGFMDRLVKYPPRDATKEEITRVHQPSYYYRLEATRSRPRVWLDADTSTCPVSFDAARRAAGAVLEAVDRVTAGELDVGFPMVRPPGHHAETDRAMGFCLFNNVAVGAAHALAERGLSKVAVLDWDLHHGNGTQHIFNNRKEVLYISTHQYPYYPGTGAAEEVGFDAGEGYTVNVPLNPTMGDHEYMKVFHKIVGPVLDQYEPDLIMVSAGFDTYEGDPLGGMNVTPRGFAQQTRFMLDKARELCDGRVVFVLEGGYDLDGLWLSTKAVFDEIYDTTRTEPGDVEAPSKADPIIEHVLRIQSKYWKL